MNVTLYRLTRPMTAEAADATHRESRYRYFVMPAKSVPRAVRILFALFAFTLPFEAMQLGSMTGMVSLPKLAGLLFFIGYLLYYNGLFSSRSLPPIPAAMWWFVAFLAVDAVNGIVFGPSEYLRDLIGAMFQLTQLIVLCWIGSDLLKDDKTSRTVLLAYTAAACLFAAGVVFKVPGFYVELAEGRESGMGQDPNAVAGNSATAIVIILGFVLYTSQRRLWLMLASVPLFGALVFSGSRGEVLAFVVGSAIYLLPYRRSKRVLAAVLLATLAIAAVIYFIAQNSDFLERWEKTYYEGDLAGREDIFPAAGEMIRERPIVGWQSVNWVYELGRRVGGVWTWRGRDAHNLYLAVLLETGLLGAVPFFIGLWWCTRAAWRARHGPLGLMPLGLLFTLLVGGMSLTPLYSKVPWLILALTLAGRTPTHNRTGKRLSPGLTKQGLRRSSEPAVPDSSRLQPSSG